VKEIEEADVIAEHALENADNLKIAAKVGLAFPAIKERIIREFISSLKGALEERLGNSWAVEDSWSENPLARGSYIAAFKTKWREDASIGLNCEKPGPSELDFFIYLGKRLKTPLASELRDALDKHYAHGQRFGNNPWWKWVEQPYRDWNTEDALLRLWRKDEAVDYYAGQLLRICGIAGPFLDRLCGG
jgi:hypothetical protein